MSQIKFVVCSQQQYDSIPSPGPDAGTFYYIVVDPSDPNDPENDGKGKLYIGTNLIGGGLSIEDVISYLEDPDNEHTFPGITAGDITPKSDAPVEMSSFFDIQTTGGDNDLKTGTGALRNIKGNLYDSAANDGNGGTASDGLTTGNLKPFYATDYVCTQMNLLDEDKQFGSTNTVFYFPVTRGAWGAAKTTQENNGYICVGVQPSSVKFLAGATPPESASDSGLVDCPSTTQTIDGDSRTFYLPGEKGWLVVTYASALTATTDSDGFTTFTSGTTEVGVHVAWSNYNDHVAGTSKISSIDIQSYIEKVHETTDGNTTTPGWGLAGITSVNRSISDEVDLVNGYVYSRIDRIPLSSMSWISTSETGQYSSDLLEITTDGLWSCKSESSVFTSLTFDGNTFTINFADGKGTSDLTNSMYLYYEKSSQEQKSITVQSNTVEANDFGLTYFLDDRSTHTDLTVPVKAFVEESFQQSGKDQIFNNITYVRTMAEVVATALCEIDSRLVPIEESIENGFEYLKITDLDVTNLNITGDFNLLEWIDF